MSSYGSKNPNYGTHAVPPASHIQHCGLHWLEVRDYDNHFMGYVALQWNPESRTWTHSNMHGVDPKLGGGAVSTNGYRYVKHIPLPEIGE